MANPIITLENVTRTFQVKRQIIKAVDDVSLSICEGEIMCLVGESGCGKTTTGKMIAGVLPISSGKILYRHQSIDMLRGNDQKNYRLAVQMIHQDPYASLNPAHTILQIVAAPLRHHGFTRDETHTQN